MKRAFTVVLCFVLFHTILASDALALAPGAALSRQAVKVAGAVARLGSGDNALVALRLQDKTVVKGRIAAIGRDSFLVAGHHSEHRVLYWQVVRLQGVNLATGAQAHIGGGFKARMAQVAALVLPIRRAQANSLTGGEKTLLLGIIIGVLLAIVLAKTL